MLNNDLIKVDVAFLCHNEEENILNLLDSMLSIFEMHKDNLGEVIVVDNNSTDRTYDVVLNYSKYKVKLIKNAKKLSYSETLKVSVKSSNATNIIIYDGDGQFPVSTVSDILREFELGSDAVFAIRLNLSGSKQRKLGSKVFKFLTKIIIGFDGKDINAGVRGLSTKMKNQIQSLRAGRLANPQLWKIAQNNRLNIGYVKTVSLDRNFGDSSIPWSSPVRLAYDSIVELIRIRNLK